MEPQLKKRRQRTTKPSPGDKTTQIRFTERDMAILQDLMTTRYITAPQLQALYWIENRGGVAGQITACRRRVKLLHEAGLMRRVTPIVQQHTGGTSPILYALDKAGAQLLANHLGIELSAIDYKPHEREANWPFLQHLLDVTTARIIFTQAAAARGLQMVAWYNELELRSDDLCDVVYLTDPDGTQHKAAVVPDALFCLQNAAGKRANFFVEIDRQTVTVEPGNWAKRGWMRKSRVYEAYFTGDAYKQRFANDIVPVLTISTGEVRVTHLREATEKVTKSKRFWFTTFDQLTAETAFGAIWQRANMEGLHPLLG